MQPGRLLIREGSLIRVRWVQLKRLVISCCRCKTEKRKIFTSFYSTTCWCAQNKLLLGTWIILFNPSCFVTIIRKNFLLDKTMKFDVQTNMQLNDCILEDTTKDKSGSDVSFKLISKSKGNKQNKFFWITFKIGKEYIWKASSFLEKKGLMWEKVVSSYHFVSGWLNDIQAAIDSLSKE